MTYKQQEQHRRLRKAVADAYREWQNGGKQGPWLKAQQRLEQFEDKYL